MMQPQYTQFQQMGGYMSGGGKSNKKTKKYRLRRVDKNDKNDEFFF